MKTERPVHLNLFKITLPLAGVVSITHRITGGILFVGLAFALYALDLALSSPAGFAQAQEMVAQPLPHLILLALIFVLSFHFVAGVKHLMLDFHIGDTVEAARAGAWVVIIASLLITAVLGVLLW